MENEIIEVPLEGVLKITKGGELLAVVHNDMQKRSQVFYSCKEMGVDEIKALLETLIIK